MPPVATTARRPASWADVPKAPRAPAALTMLLLLDLPAVKPAFDDAGQTPTSIM
jgi:hypothetical protein